MSQLLRFISLSFLIFVSVKSLGQCPDKGFTPGQFSIIGLTGGISVNGDGDGLATSANNTILRICEGESIILAKTAPTTGTAGGVHYWLIEEALYNSTAYSFPSNTATSFANYDPSLGAISTQVTLNTANLPGPSSPSPYKYNGPGRYLLIQKDNSYSAGTPDNYYACQVIEIISPTITKPNFTLSSCIDGSAVVSLPTDAINNVFYNYNIVYKDKATGGAFSSSTGLVTSYPKHITQFISSTTKNYEITVTGQTQTGGCVGASTVKDITVKKASNPKAGLITGQATNGTYEIEFVAEKDVARKVYIRTANSAYDFSQPAHYSFKSVATSPLLYDTPSISVPNPDKQYCFIATAVNDNLLCPTGGTPPVGEEACTTTLSAVSGDKKNDLTWSPFVTGMLGGVFASYEIYREGTALPIARITSAGTTTYSDAEPSLVCGTKYKYKVVTNYGAASTSSPIEVEFKQTTKSKGYDQIYATVSDDNSYVKLVPSNSNGTKPPIDAVINIYRKEFSTGTFSKYVVEAQDKINMQYFDVFQDNNVETTKKQYCYYVTWELGLCGESNPSNEVCTILLKRNGSNLEWTSDSPMSVPIGQYDLTNAMDPNSTMTAPGNFVLTNCTTFLLLSNSVVKGQEFWMKVMVGNANGTGNPVSQSNYIHYDRPTVVLVPQIFTPDGNSLNETFDIQGRYIRKTKMWIYDRWGSPIYYKETDTDQTDSATGLWKDTGWDGTLSNGQKAAQGNYAYKIEVEDATGKKTVKSGALNLTY